MKKFAIENVLSIGLSGLILLSFVGCGSDEPENPGFSPIPAIQLDKLKFIEVGGPIDYDTLKLTISYRDGDSDLGLSYIDKADFQYPFHSEEYFLEDGNGDTIPLHAELIDNQWGINSIPQGGTLITNDTREKANYGFLPAYNPSSCLNYSPFSDFLVRKDLNIVDESFNITDTTTIEGVDFIRMNEVLLYRINNNHFNILVDFYVFNGVDFQRYDWMEEYCMTYNGRFPLILDKRSGRINGGNIKVNIKSPWEGKITYSMPNTSFPAIFGDTPLKLAITIKDRALNTSNTILTSEFKLQDIK